MTRILLHVYHLRNRLPSVPPTSRGVLFLCKSFKVHLSNNGNEDRTAPTLTYTPIPVIVWLKCIQPADRYLVQTTKVCIAQTKAHTWGGYEADQTCPNTAATTDRTTLAHPVLTASRQKLHPIRERLCATYYKFFL